MESFDLKVTVFLLKSFFIVKIVNSSYHLFPKGILALIGVREGTVGSRLI